MPDPAPLLLALAAGTMSASYAILLRLGAGSINPALGALIISGVALPFTAVVFAILRVWHPGTMITTKGWSLMILAGIAAASTTVFGLLAYARGFKLSFSRHHGNTSERRPACWVRVLEGTVQHWTAAGADPHRARYSGTPATRRLNNHGQARPRSLSSAYLTHAAKPSAPELWGG